MGFQGSARAAKSWFRDVERFVRDYTAGLKARDLRRLFDHDASQAYDVLIRDRGSEPEPAERFHRLLYRIKIVFLGLSYKLTPARRALFAASIFCFLLGLLNFRIPRSGSFRIDFSPFWFFLSIAGLIFLLTLELVDRIRVRDELEVARELQSVLLPRSVPEIEGYRMAHSYRTANEVGGDYYDFPVLPDGRLALMVGDASGHGMAAGLLMAIANATVKLAMDLDPSPLSVLRLLNQTLLKTGDRRAFMTLFYGLLAPQTGELEYVCAGHPFPLHRKAGGVGVSELGRGGFPLGIRETLDLVADRTTLEPADTLVLFSDGLPEATNRSGETFGYERLQWLVEQGGTPQALHERILLDFDDHLGGEPLRDDFSLVVVGRM